MTTSFENDKEAWEAAADSFWTIYWQVKESVQVEGVPVPFWKILDGSMTKNEVMEQARQEYDNTLTFLREQKPSGGVPHQPDAEAENEDFERPHVYLNRAAALALWLKIRDGYSEDVLDALKEAWQAAYNWNWGERFDWATSKDDSGHPFEANLVSVTAIVLLELFQAHNKYGNYQAALHALALALDYASKAIDDALSDSERLWWNHSASLLNKEKRVPIVDLDAQETVNVFQSLRASGRASDWRQIAEDCRLIANFWANCLRAEDEVVKDSDGREWYSRNFWWQASGWALARLEPSQYIEELKRVDDERVEETLVSYFFQEPLSHCLPERARRSLIEAARAWSLSRRGRPENVLNELRIATEELLYAVIWMPLEQWTRRGFKDRRLLDFHKLKSELAEKRKEPSLVHYEKMLGSEALKEFVKSEPMYEQHREFIVTKLPGALRELRVQRRHAEHETSRIWGRKEIAPLFNRFLGIGCEGILPRLAELHLRMAGPRTKRNNGGSTTHFQRN